MNKTEYIDGIPIDEYRVNMVKMPKEELEKLYLEQNKTISQIAKHFNCHYRTVYNRLKRLNIPIRQGRPKKKLRIHLGHKELAEILKKNYTIDEIAKKLRTTSETVRRYIQKYGL
jgi:transposase